MTLDVLRALAALAAAACRELFIFAMGAKCHVCRERHRSDFCPRCFWAEREEREYADRRVIAHPEMNWEWRLREHARRRWPKAVGE